MSKYVIGIVLVFCFNTLALAEPDAKITLKVVDENGNPVEGASAGLRFILPGKGLSTKTAGDRGLTDGEGLFAGSGESPQYVGYGASKDGYYSTSNKIRMDEITGIFGFRRWQPWNPTIEIVLKKKINPIPLYARRMDSIQSKYLPETPILDRFVGYDLIERDWVVPYGLGTHRDFLFKLEIHSFVSVFEHNVTLTLKFTNDKDGIQSYYDKPDEGSNLRLPHEAPTVGYDPELIINEERTSTKRLSKKAREDQNYFFRVRTEKDEQGNIISALYGKIHGNIELADVDIKSKTGMVRFNYYLNPTPNDTNLEFDSKKNLFKDLTQNEEVMNP